MEQNSAKSWAGALVVDGDYREQQIRQALANLKRSRQDGALVAHLCNNLHSQNSKRHWFAAGAEIMAAQWLEQPGLLAAPTEGLERGDPILDLGLLREAGLWGVEACVIA